MTISGCNLAGPNKAIGLLAVSLVKCECRVGETHPMLEAPKIPNLIVPLADLGSSVGLNAVIIRPIAAAILLVCKGISMGKFFPCRVLELHLHWGVDVGESEVGSVLKQARCAWGCMRGGKWRK
jgi:hypothetical protein